MRRQGIGMVLGMTAMLCCMGQPAAASDALKIGYVSLSRVFQEYTKVIAANAELDKTKQQVKDMIARGKDLEKNLDQLSEKVREERTTQLSVLQDDINRNMMEIRKEEDRILRDILKDIETVAAELRKKEKWTFILDDRLVIDGDSQYDLTDKMIELLNKQHGGKR